MGHEDTHETQGIESVRESDKAEDGRKVPDGGLVEGGLQAVGVDRPEPKTIDWASFVQWRASAGVHCPVPVAFEGLRWVPGDWERVTLDNSGAACWAQASGVVLQHVPGWLVVYREPGAEGEGWALCMTFSGAWWAWVQPGRVLSELRKVVFSGWAEGLDAQAIMQGWAQVRASRAPEDRAQVVAEVREAREASLVALLGLAMLPASWPQELAFVVVIVVAALVLALWSRSAERTLGEGPTGPGDDDGLTHRPRHGEPTGEALLDPTPFLPITSGAGDDAAEVSAVICAGIVGSLALALDEHHAAVADRLGLNDAEVGLMRRHDLVNCCARWSAVGCMLGIGREFGGGMAVECDLFATRKGSPLFEHLQAIHLALHAALHDDVRAPLHGARAIASAHRLAVHLFPDLRLVKWSLHPVDSEGKCVGWRFPRRCYAQNVLGVFAAQFMGAER